ncbi:hypothetical protein [Faecalimonas canis]
MKTLNQYMVEQLKNDEFRKAWEHSQLELDVIRAIVDSQNLTKRNFFPTEMSIASRDIFMQGGRANGSAAEHDRE